MKMSWTVLLCALTLALTLGAMAQDTDNSNNPKPELKTRPNNRPQQQQQPSVSNPSSNPSSNQSYGVRPDAIPEGTRFIVKLKDTLDTHDMQPGKRFKAELREDLVTPSGLIIPKGRPVKGHVGTFERGYTGSRIQLAMDEVETRHGWVPLIATVTGVPGDSSVKSTDNEGELSRRGPDKKRVITNAAIGAGVGAASGAAIGGGKGAAVGAVVGAGLGTGSAFLIRGSDMKLSKETQLEVRLDRDLVVPSR
jgi:hypothetical protein